MRETTNPHRTSLSPDSMPVLSVGRHRSARKGACFMEFASFLAGEKWSDHPACTHPALAALARSVNDSTSNAARGELAPHIPSVIGLTGNDPRVELSLAVMAGCAALPIAAEGRQRALAAGLIRCEALALAMGGAFGERLVRDIHAALNQVPLAERWARPFVARAVRGRTEADLPALALLVELAVRGIAEACTPDADSRLRDLLVASIAETRALLHPAPVAEKQPALV